MMRSDGKRAKQIAVGGCILLALTVMICGMLLGWRYLPGLFGEWVGLMVGLVTTPVILEVFFVILGLTVVVVINHWQRIRDGDELVYLEPESGGRSEAGRLERAKICMAAGDFETAASLVEDISASGAEIPEVLMLRIAVAKSQGDGEQVAKLEGELDSLKVELN